jgi:hypothetical protein
MVHRQKTEPISAIPTFFATNRCHQPFQFMMQEKPDPPTRVLGPIGQRLASQGIPATPSPVPSTGGAARSAWCVTHHHLRSLRTGVALAVSLFFSAADVQAICGLDEAFLGELSGVDEPALAGFRNLSISCSVCHLGERGGPRNVYGNILNTILDLTDREDPARQREAGRRVSEIDSDPSSPSFTFGELIRKGQLPGAVPTVDDGQPPGIATRALELLTADRARQLVLQAEAESRFGMLQMSNVEEISPEVAGVLAEFKGEFLILGIRSISPAVAEALAKSRVANLWLHSVTSVLQGSAEFLSTIPGHLVMTGLTRLDSVALAEKLASRPGALSFPYLKALLPEVAEALATREGSLTLTGLSEVSPEAQDVLAANPGAVSLPSLTSLDSLSLTRKLASGSPVLTQLGKLTPEQAGIIAAAINPPSFFSTLTLPLAAITPEVAGALNNQPRGINLTLVGGGPITDQTLETLLGGNLNLNLRDVEKLSINQARIARDAVARKPGQAGVVSVSSVSLPAVRDLDSALLAEFYTFAGVRNVTRISPEAAAFLGDLPVEKFLNEPDGELLVRPTGELSFPFLTDLSPETAQLLLKRRWNAISLPSVAELSPETLQSLARATPNLAIGITTLSPESARALAEFAAEQDTAGARFLFPRVKELSPEAARILVGAFNRGTQVDGQQRLSRSPTLGFGEVNAAIPGGFTLSPETATELARYDGSLSLGLDELSGDSARALSQFGGVYLQIGGPATDSLAPDAAEALAKTPATLLLPLRELDSVPLAARFASQHTRSFHRLESISPEAITALVNYQQRFDVRKIAVLDSPELASRFLRNNWGPTLPALTRISPQAAEIVASSPNEILLGLTVIDSPAVATALATSQAGVKLPRLRAATPEVIAILDGAEGIKSPPLPSLYLLR